MIAAALFLSVAAADDARLAAAALDVLTARCASCHSPDAEDPKARRRFDFAADLAHTAAEYVVPREPGLSELWLEIDGRTMPPPDSPTGPVTADERAAVLAWIQAGAPTAIARGIESVAALSSPQASASPRSGPRGLAAIGRLHPATVHFPIAFVLGAAFLELLAIARRSRGGTSSTSVLVLLRMAAATAPIVALLGWWNALEASASDLLDRHRWTGVAVAVSAVVAWALAERARDPARSRTALRITLFVAAILTALAGHWGGELVFGSGYVPFAPWAP
jgi:uncharacterized membrane protein/mono/diheme cytochrome c family protein